jgi:hypothetical protein
MKKAIYRLIGLAILAGAGYGLYQFFKQGPERQTQTATAKVQRGDVVIRAFTRGELKAVRTYPLYAPNLNGTVQVTQLAPMGALAAEKNLIVEYDDSELLAQIDADQLSLDTADENIKAQKLQMEITRSADQLKLLRAQFSVRRGELNKKKNDVIDLISAKKNDLNLEQYQRQLSQTEVEIEQRKKQQDSQLQVQASNRRRFLQTLQLDQARLLTTKTLAPMSGMVAIKQNRGGNFNFGQQMPDIRPGDQVQAGMNVADLLDLSEMELSAKVGEMDRANLKEGQEMFIQLDSVPDKRFPGKIKTLSGTATADVFSGDPSKKFDVTFSIDMRTLLTGLGMKPATIDQLMKTAAENSKKNLVSFAPTMGGGRGGGRGGDFGGFPGGGFPGGPEMDLSAMAALQGGGRQGGGEGRQARGAGAQGRGGQSGANGQSATAGRGRGDASQGGGAASQARGGFGGRGVQTAENGQATEAGRGRGQGRGGENGNARGRGAGGGGSAYSDEERQNARLPNPPEENSDVSVLLRPGLLADVEIMVESIPNALHVPAQSVFTKNGKLTVYVMQKNGKFQPREVEMLKKSETTMVLASGVREGEVVALEDPTANKSDKKGATEEKKGSSSAMPMPGAK